jgi:hypothetical protein
MWEEPILKNRLILNDLDIFTEPEFYLKTFLNKEDYEKIIGLNPFNIFYYNHICKMCMRGYVEKKEDKKDVDDSNLSPIEKMKKERLKKFKAKEDSEEESENDTSSRELHVIIAFMRGDLKQPYDNIMNMTLSFINSTIKQLADESKEREEKEKSEKRKGKLNKNKANIGKTFNIDELNVPKL